MSIDWSKMRTASDLAAEQAQADYEAWKVERKARVDALEVEVDGLVFQGNEISQGRMLRRADTLNGDETADWVLADNTVVQVTSAQLRAAARAAVDEMGRIWIGTA